MPFTRHPLRNRCTGLLFVFAFVFALVSSRHAAASLSPIRNPISAIEKTGETQAETTLYGHNALNQLVSTNGAGGSSSYTYDLEGNRISKTKVDGNGTHLESYAYDYNNRLVEWIGEVGGQMQSFQYGYDHRTRRVQRAENGVLTQVVFSGGTSVQEYLLGSDKGGDEWMRYCNLKTGIWLSRDPFGTPSSQFNAEMFGSDAAAYYEEGIFNPELLPDGPNLYGYVGNNPINQVDPSGEVPPVAIGAAIIGGKLIQLGIKYWTKKAAARAAAKGADVICKNRSTARSVAEQAGKGKPPIGPERHGPAPDYRPHYHNHDRTAGHVFY